AGDRGAGRRAVVALARPAPQLAEVQVDRAVVDADRVAAQVGQDRRAERPAGGVVEPAVVHRALDHVVHDQAVAEQRLLVRAVPVGGVVAVAGRAVDRVRPPGVVEGDYVLGVDVAGLAGGDPLGHRLLLRPALRRPARGPAAGPVRPRLRWAG